MKTAKIITFRHLKDLLVSMTDDELDKRIMLEGRFGDPSFIVMENKEFDTIDISTPKRKEENK